MAEPKGGLLAIIGGGKPDDSEKSEKSGASSAKARALESMWSAMKSGDFDEAAEHFQEAYDECAMHSEEGDTEEDIYEGDDTEN